MSEEDFDIALRLCVPTAIQPDPIPGSVIRDCGTCGCSVWYDALQRSPYSGLPEQLICIDCGRLHPEVGPEIERIERDPAEARRMLMEVLQHRAGS